MFNRIKKAAAAAKDATADAVANATGKLTSVSDLNGDGKLDANDLKIAGERAKDLGRSIAAQTAPIRRTLDRNDLAKDAATGAAICTLIASPLPVVGSLTGAALGAGIGVYKNLTTKRSSNLAIQHAPEKSDLHAELIKLDDLKTRGLLTENEFLEQKSKLLNKA